MGGAVIGADCVLERLRRLNSLPALRAWRWLSRKTSVKLSFIGVMCAVMAVAAAATPQPDSNSATQLARRTGGEIGPSAFARLTSAMDASMLRLASRFDPQAGGALLQPAVAGTQDTVAGSAQAAVAPEPAVLRLQDLTPDQARAWNAANPIAPGPNPAARPFLLKTAGVMDEARAVDCLTAAIYYEAAWETVDGQRAVAQVILNRMRHPAYPKTVCGVVFQGSNRVTGCQFTFTCDGALARRPNEAAWSRARKVAVAALNGYVMRQVGNATHYHANYVAPYWSPNLHKVATIGAHIFYRWTGGWGMPGAFGGRYAGTELEGMQIAALDKLATPPKLDLVAAKEGEDPELPFVQPETPKAKAADQGAKDAAAAEPPKLVTVAEATQGAPVALKPEDLDWQGRPKRRQSQLAMPSSF